MQRTRKRTTATAAVLLTALGLLLSACGGQSSTANGTQPNDADIAFVEGMIPHHRQAVEMAVLVEGRTDRPELVELAGNITRTQDDEITLMEGWLRDWNEPAAGGGMDHGSMGHGFMEGGFMEGGSMEHGSMEHGMPDHGGMDGHEGMMTPEQMQELAGDKGEAFDVAFVSMMIEHHEGAVQTSQAVREDGQHPDVAALAGEIIEAQQREIDQMRTWQETWAKP